MIHERLLAEATRYFRHKPRYSSEDKALEPVPYLRLPFTNESLRHVPVRKGQLGIGSRVDYSVSEGWFYSKRVRKYVPFGHGAVDFALPYGHPVVAPCDGYAMSSYHAYPILDRKGQVKVKNGISQRFGIGYFVQIYNSEQNRFVQLGHLSNVADAIPFSIPKKIGGVWHATGQILTNEEMIRPENFLVRFVKTGELVGFVGYSGLTSEEDYKPGYERPYIIDPAEVSSWSIPHIHMDEFQRNYITGMKDSRRDPFDIYMKDDSYPTHTNSNDIGRDPLFLTDQYDRPLFADT